MENIGFYDGNNSVPTSRLAFEAESPRIISRSSGTDPRPTVSSDNNNAGGCSGRGVVIMDIITVDGCSCDVLMDSEKISWTPLSGERTKSGSSAGIRRSKFIKGSREIEEDDTSESTIYLSHVLGANIRRLQKTGQLENQGTCIGFGVYIYKVKESGVKFVEEVVLFNHPSEQISKKWCLSIQQYIASKTERPRSVKVFLQPFAGKRCSRTIFSSKVQPLFRAAGISTDITEVNRDGSNISQVISQMDLSDFSSVVCVGGDGTVGRVVTAMLNRVQADEGVNVEKTGFEAKCCPLPIGIIPTGSLNETVFSLIGTDDVTTAVVHILLGHVTAADVCSVRNGERFLCWSFNSHFGFFGSLFAYANKYSVLGEKRFEVTVVRMLSKNKYRPFNCRIQFIPAENSESCNPRNGILCREGCVQCKMSKEANDPAAFNYGQVEAFNDSDSSSSSSCGNIKASESDERYQTISGDFLSVSLLTMPGVCVMAPSGHSPFTHIRDGCVDLVVVENVGRKEFVRYIRRFSNAKNQLDLPFVKSFRCKEIRVTPVMNGSWKDNGGLSTGIGNLAVGGQSGEKLSTKSKSRDSSEELDVNGRDNQNSDSSTDSAGEEEETSKEAQKTRQGSKDIDHQGNEAAKAKKRLFRRPSKLHQALVSLKSEFLGAEFAETSSSSHLPSGSSSVGKRKNFQPTWVLGMELHDEQHLQFRVHEGLVKFHGLGIPSSYHPSQLKWPCLAMF